MLRFQGFRRLGLALLFAAAIPARAPAAADKVAGGFNLFSESAEAEIGRKYSEELNRDLALITTPEIVGYIETLGKRLGHESLRPDLQYHFFVVNTEEVNAYALPGGYVYVNRGLVDVTDNESELAGAIGHEMGHVIARHATKEISRQMLLSGLMMASQATAGPRWSDSIQLGGRSATYFAGLRFSREDERQSDSLGLDILYKAGFDPRAMATLFEKIDALGGGAKGGARLSFMNSHPMAADRARWMRADVERLSHVADVDSSLEYEKAKLALMVHPWPEKKRPGPVKTLLRPGETSK